MKKTPTIPNNLPTSANRPSWTQTDLYAHRHLHHYNKKTGKYEIGQNHFVGTRGFATMQDLRYFEGGGCGNGN